MIFADVIKWVVAIKQKQTRGSLNVFINMVHKLDKEIEQYLEEQPYDDLVIIKVVKPNLENGCSLNAAVT